VVGAGDVPLPFADQRHQRIYLERQLLATSAELVYEIDSA
jgi:hypothetical protein